MPPALNDFTPAAFRVWLLDFRTFLTRFHLQHYLDGNRTFSAPLVPGATTVIFLLEQAFRSVMESSTETGKLLAVMWKVHARRSSAPATILQGLLQQLGISSVNEMDELELSLSMFTPTVNEQLEHFIWRLNLALDDYNRQAPLHNLPTYSERRLFKHLLLQLPSSVTDLFYAKMSLDAVDTLTFQQVMTIVQDRIRFDSARRAPPPATEQG